MKTRGLLLLIGVQILVVSTSVAKPISLNMEWRCPGANIERTPPSRTIGITYNSEESQVNLDDLDTFLRQLAHEQPAYDFTACLLEAALPIRDLTTSEKSDYLESAVRLKIFEYSRGAYLRGAVPPFEPGAPLKTQGGSQDLSELVFAYKMGVPPYYDSRQRPILLSDEFVNNLSQIIKLNKRNEVFMNRLISVLDETIDGAAADSEQCRFNKKLCDQRRKQIQEYISRVRDAFSIQDLALYLKQCNQGNPSKYFNDLRSVIDAGGCSPMQPGEHLIAKGLSPYGLTRLDDRNGKPIFRAELNFHFTGANADVLKKKVEKCFQRSNPYLLGPEGQSLELSIGNSNDLPQIEVTVDDNVGRENMSTWSSRQSCDTTLHETFHHLGLVDEYKEHSLGNSVKNGKIVDGEGKPDLPIWDCRPLGPRDSLMGPYSNIAMNMVPSDVTTVSYCTCEFSSASLHEIIVILTSAKLKPTEVKRLLEQRNLSEQVMDLAQQELAKCQAMISKAPSGQACPAGLRKRNATCADDQSLNDCLGGNLLFTSGEISRTPQKGNVKVRRKSILYPAQFRKVVQPNCEAANRVYNECSKWSYATSRVMSPDGVRCSRPPICQRPGSDWLK